MYVICISSFLSRRPFYERTANVLIVVRKIIKRGKISNPTPISSISIRLYTHEREESAPTMVRTTLASLSISSFHPDLSSSAVVDAHRALLSREISLPYPAGKATLQLGGIHLRLLRQGSRAREGDGSMGFVVTVKAVVRGELAEVATREFVIGTCALDFAANPGAAETETETRGGGDPGKGGRLGAHPPPNGAPFAKRALNALARQAQRSQLLRRLGAAPLSSNGFLRLDLRVQSERVRLVLEVRLLRAPAANGGLGGGGGGGRKRDRTASAVLEGGEAREGRGSGATKASDPASASLDAALASYGLEAVVVGTIASLV
ncbi:unnamed protein product [Phytomonas sp. EM1]|nr:unnamed protein product [Phytomonas sp. EM1]|eukprot:CCW65505.1 unnamed protein product [Phytomonas sp. isolate EM1]